MVTAKQRRKRGGKAPWARRSKHVVTLISSAGTTHANDAVPTGDFMSDRQSPASSSSSSSSSLSNKPYSLDRDSGSSRVSPSARLLVDPARPPDTFPSDLQTPDHSVAIATSESSADDESQVSEELGYINGSRPSPAETESESESSDTPSRSLESDQSSSEYDCSSDYLSSLICMKRSGVELRTGMQHIVESGTRLDVLESDLMSDWRGPLKVMGQNGKTARSAGINKSILDFIPEGRLQVVEFDPGNDRHIREGLRTQKINLGGAYDYLPKATSEETMSYAQMAKMGGRLLYDLAYLIEGKDHLEILIDLRVFYHRLNHFLHLILNTKMRSMEEEFACHIREMSLQEDTDELAERLDRLSFMFNELNPCHQLSDE